MKASLVTPARKDSRTGNRTTAMRWARILRDLGLRVQVETAYGGDDADLMIALHAWRSADSIREFRARHPERPLVVALTGTDIYRFQHSHPEATLASMASADILVGLHDLVADALPEPLRGKVKVIYQSAPLLPRRLPPLRRIFEVLVIGHLREEKDPLRAAYAARELPPESRLRIVHLGKAHDASWAEAAQAEMARNPRYHWRGEQPGWAVRRALARAPLMVLSSIMEGGANVVSEAVVAGVPVIASAIPGSIGLLGPGYPGYYPAKDTAALAALLRRAEGDPAFLDELGRHCRARAPLFDPARERQAWRDLLAALNGGG
ncbi:MAG TPA: selenoneine biosynthesis selenosugar synthase SenB [Alphaproteobacteria bacterium]|nr:selenoneine biosynthesis selenosugar synthase SenB [Alphaproteobacteria bacterium]